MATEMITLKLDDKFLDEIDSFVKKEGYKNRTEFIRMALRSKVDECKLREAMASIAQVRGDRYYDYCVEAAAVKTIMLQDKGWPTAPWF